MKWIGIFLMSGIMGLFFGALVQALVPSLTRELFVVVSFVSAAFVFVTMARASIVARNIEVRTGH